MGRTPAHAGDRELPNQDGTFEPGGVQLARRDEDTGRHGKFMAGPLLRQVRWGELCEVVTDEATRPILRASSARTYPLHPGYQASLPFTGLQRVGLHQVLQVVEVALRLPLAHAHDERLGELEEAARLPLDGRVDSRAAFDRLEGH